ncbi:DUF397 domain-containing protein [Streptomyces sp. NBC_00669]|uniref:DUF397 domain-containing protein n=1 Tax=unclassified Streptomyces TaxID=2593676 RepID=UPI002E303025|nr:DUF397 domain-containing protein [Streptomyces sp. NBC_00669]
MDVVINANILAPELADESVWFKSSYSNDSGGVCVEVAPLAHAVGIRDSKDKAGPALLVAPAEWASFVDLVRSGAVDFGVV